MATDISDVQMQRGSVTVQETVMVSDSIRDASDKHIDIKESVTSSHLCDVSRKQADQSVKRVPNDTALVLEPNLCKCNDVGKPRISVTRDLSFQTDLFYQVIEIYQKATKGRHLPPDFDIKKAHNWDEVSQAAKLAEAKCKKDGTRSIFSKVARGIQRSAPAAEPWLGLIPDGDYTSVLCGGLKMVFGVAGRIHEQRVQIFETFQQIPDTIRLAEDRLEEWPDDEVLHDAAIELYLAVLKSVEAMIIWLVDTSTRRKIGQLLMIPKTGKPKDLGLDGIEKEVRRLQGRATTLQSKAIVRTDANVEKTGSVVDMLKVSTQNIERIMIEELRPVMNETHHLVRETRLTMEVYGKATRSNTQANGIGLRKPERDLFELGSHILIGRCGELKGSRILSWELELADPIVKVTRPINSTTMDQWAERKMSPEAVAKALHIGVHRMMYHIEERYADAPRQEIVSMDSVNSTITVHLSYFRKGDVEKLKREHALANSMATRIPTSGRQTPIKSKL